MGQKVAVLHQQFRGGFTSTADSQDCRGHDVRWSGLNQTGLIIGNACKPNQSVLNSKPFQEVL